MDDRTFSERLQEEMLRNDITSVALSARTGINPKTIYSYLHGKQTNPSLLNVKKIANALHSSVSYLMDGKTTRFGRDLERRKEFMDELKSVASESSNAEKIEMVKIILQDSFLP